MSLLKKLREIQKVLLSSGAYSSSNMEKQNIQFDRVNVPEWEREIIFEMWNVQTKLSHKLLKKSKILMEKIKIDLNFEGD